MATKTIQIVQDDIDGSENAQTYAFTWDGTSYEIDLSEDHAAELSESLRPWIEHARRTRGNSRGASGRRAAAPSPSHPLSGRTQSVTDKGLSSKVIRAWAHEHGVQVPDRGRIPESVIQQYETAQAAPPPAPEPEPPAKTAAKKAPAKRGGRAKAAASAEA